jgi:hypothetical protein
VKEGGGVGVRNWVNYMLVKVVGNEENTLFWLDDNSFCNRFRRLFC